MKASNYLELFTSTFLLVNFVVRFLTYGFYFSNFILFLLVNKLAHIIKMVSDRLMQSAKYLKAGPNWETSLLFLLFSFFLVVPLIFCFCSDPLIAHFQ